MTERGLPLVDGAPACPFVAFEDDRDERASSPDHRHRCYAEIRPAPRALAHQEAYCLSSAFPVCPTFQDWARREAARTRSAESPVVEEPQRNPPREWSAPPPWMGDDDKADDEAGAGIAAGAAGAMVGAAGAMAGAAGGAESDAEGPAFLTGRSRAEGGLAGSAADRIAAGEAVGEAWGPRSGAAGASGPLAAAPDAADVSGEAEAADARHDPAAFHDREPRVSDYGAGDRGAGDHGAGDRDAQGGISSAAGGGIVAEERRSIDRPGAGRRLPERRLPERRQPERRPSVAESRRQRAPVDVTGPAWEEPRRYEAYPTLRTRMGLPAVPPIVLAGLALVIAAVALFSLPTLLGFGNAPGPAAVSSPSPSQRGAAASVTPSAAPAATPTIYFVRAGDNLAKIAKRFGTTIDAILKANPQIKDPNRIKVGDQITIPVRKSGSGSAGPGSSPSSNP